VDDEREALAWALAITVFLFAVVGIVCALHR
jgi:hypothetical protein